MGVHSKLILKSPYKGLIPYAEEDVLFFFGREDWEEIITANLKNSPMTVLYGTSGVGKTSVLRAGVARRLRQEAMQDCMEYGTPKFAVVVFPSLDGRRSWSSPDPLASLREQIEIDLQSVLGRQEFESRSSASKFEQVIKDWTERIGGKSAKGRLLIILDQFEEYFWNLTQGKGTGIDSFAQELSQAVKNTSLNANFLIAIRDDLLAKLDYFDKYIPNWFNNHLEIPHLDEKAARKAIEKPIAEYNRQFIILENLLKSRLTVLYGESNVHKSTLLNCGIADSLRQAAKENLKQQDDKPELAVVVFNDWQKKDKDLLTTLKQKIKTDIENLGFIESPSPDLSLVDTLQEWTKRIGTQTQEGELFIILDQFEKYFLLYSKQEGKHNFIEKLVDAINNPSLKVNFLISINENKLSELNSFKESMPCEYYLHLFKDDRGIDRIEEVKPENFNQSNQSLQKKFSIELDLVDEVMKGIIKQGVTKQKKEPIETFLLQLVMERLWKEERQRSSSTLRRTTFLELGKDWSTIGSNLTEAEKSVNRILKDYLYDKLESLLGSQKDIAASIFHYLVTPSGSKLPQSIPDLLELTNEYRFLLKLPQLEKSRVEQLCHALVPLRILRQIGEDRYEIFHDVLCKPILDWGNSFRAKQVEEQRQREGEEREKIESQILSDLGDEVRHLIEEKQKKESQIRGLLRNRMESTVEKLVSLSLSEKGQKALLLARQAYLFNQKYELNKLNAVDKALRQAINTPHFHPILQGHDKQVSSVVFHPDSKMLASGSFDGIVQLWDLTQSDKSIPLSFGLKTRENEGDGGGILSIAISQDGEKLAVGCGDNKVRVLDLNQPPPTPIVLNGHKHEVWSVAFSRDGKLLASGGWDNKVYLWDLENSENSPIYGRVLPDRIWSVAFSPDGQTLAAGCRNGTVWLWKLLPSKKLKLQKVLVINEEQKKNLRHNFDPNVENDRKREIFSIAFSPDRKLLVAGSWDDKARFWDLSEPDQTSSILLPIQEIEGQNMKRLIVAFSPDGKRLALGSTNGTVQLWKRKVDSFTFDDKIRLTGTGSADKQRGISSLAFSQDNQWLGSGSWDGTVKLWHLQPEPIVLDEHKHHVVTLAFSPSGKMLASGSFDATTRLWEWNNPERESILLKDINRGNINSVTFSPDGQIVASGNLQGEIQLWYPYDLNKVPQLLSDCGQEISSVAFRPTDGKILAAGSHGRKVLLWDLSNPDRPNPLPSLVGHKDRVKAVAFSPDGKILASGDNHHIVRLWWNLGLSPASFIELPQFKGRISSISFNPKPFKELQILAIATDKEKIEFWDVSSLQENREAQPSFLIEYYLLKELKGTCVAFSPDGLFFASGSYDGNVRLWDLQQLQANPIVLEGHAKPVRTVAFSPDGERLATGSDDGIIRVWIAKTEMIANMVCQKVRQNLTLQEWNDVVGESIPYEFTCPALPPDKEVLSGDQADTPRDEFDPEQYKIDKTIDLSEEEILELIRSSQSPQASICIDEEQGVVWIDGVQLQRRRNRF